MVVQVIVKATPQNLAGGGFDRRAFAVAEEQPAGQRLREAPVQGAFHAKQCAAGGDLRQPA